MTSDLLTSILEGGIRSPNFFNGRLLSSEDLNLEKTANRDACKRLARAIGDGVAFGLEVAETVGVSTHDRPVVTVMPGLAVNRRGKTLMLMNPTDISLVRSVESGAGATETFEDCKPPSSGVYVAGAGVYLLVVCPASSKEGRAPVSGLGNVAASCNSKYVWECLQFRLINIPLSDLDQTDTAHLRNRVAYECFGLNSAGYTSQLTDPFAAEEAEYGVLDGLRPNVLTDCDVPLALLYWTSAGGIEFIDLWSVRRRINPPPPFERWVTPAGSRRFSEGEAMILQFQEQASELVRSSKNPASLKASAYFDYLPPLGFLPLDAGSRWNGINPVNFFDGLTVREAFSTAGTYVPAKGRAIRDGIYIESARLSELTHDAMRYPPIDLSSRQMIWMYVVRENMQAIADKTVEFPRPFVVFVNGQMNYRGNARYDVNRWNYGNYSISTEEL